MSDVRRRQKGRAAGVWVAMLLTATPLALAFTAPAHADEAKTPVSASMFLNLTAPRIDSREVAYDQTLRGDNPVPKAWSTEPEVLADGSVRYGKATVTVRNPCPPGSGHYEPVPLPGRRVRN